MAVSKLVAEAPHNWRHNIINAERDGKLSILGYCNFINLRFAYFGITLPSSVCKVGIWALKKIPLLSVIYCLSKTMM